MSAPGESTDASIVVIGDHISGLSIGDLREKCESLSISKLGKKSDLVDTIQKEFSLLPLKLKQFTLPELRDCCKANRIVGYSSMKKEELVASIVKKNISHLSNPKQVFILPDKVPITEKPHETKDDTPSGDTPEVIIIVEEKIAESPKESPKALVNESLPIVPEEEKKPRKKQAIPKAVRVHVWNLYIGPNIIEHRCLCCKKSLIKNTEFEVGHIISEKDGGTQEISNLRPICTPCNLSMGTTNMIEYIKKFGYYL
jgi:5-methylcytosine-specific restriction endonuclease McrA